MSKGDAIQVKINNIEVTATVYAIAIGKVYWTYTDNQGNQTIGWIKL